MDYQEDLSLHYSSKKEEEPDDEAVLKMDLSVDRGKEKDAAKIHIDTLVRQHLNRWEIQPRRPTEVTEFPFSLRLPFRYGCLRIGVFAG